MFVPWASAAVVDSVPVLGTVRLADFLGTVRAVESVALLDPCDDWAR